MKKSIDCIFRHLCRDGVLTSVARCLRGLVNAAYPGYEVRLDTAAVETWLASRWVAPLFVLNSPDSVWELIGNYPEFAYRLIDLHLGVNPEMATELSRIMDQPVPPVPFRFTPEDWPFFRTAAEKFWLRDPVDTWDLRDRDWLRRGAWPLSEAATLARQLLEDADILEAAKQLLVHCKDPGAAARVLAEAPHLPRVSGRSERKKRLRRDATIVGIRRYGDDPAKVAAFWRAWQEAHPEHRFTHPSATFDSLYRLVLAEFTAMEAEALREAPHRRQGVRR
jgi:hypothetical protein